MRLTIEQLQALAASVGFPDPSTAAAVAMAESGGNPNIVGDVTLGRSIGLWQINLAAHPQYDEQSLTDPTTNALAALAISYNGTNWNPWTTYRTGAYEKYLAPYVSPAAPSTKAWWIAGGILAVGGGAIWWMSLSPRERRRIRRMLPA